MSTGHDDSYQGGASEAWANVRLIMNVYSSYKVDRQPRSIYSLNNVDRKPEIFMLQ